MSRTILGEDDQSEFKLSISDTARLTYGPNVPYAKKAESTGRADGYSLRVYEGDKLLACLTNVKWFRETTIGISRVVEKVVRDTVWRDDHGGYETTTTETRKKQLLEHSDSGEGYVEITPMKKGKKTR